ncbi:MAG TPA: hypothetical protein PLP34_05355 [Chitinophagaceae bacterium]|nr:hypothetical protein [Chitinophagaceae bacterium]
MEKESRMYKISRNIGFITGPLIVLLGYIGYKNGANKGMSVFIITLGVIRTLLTVYTYRKRKEQETQHHENL